uniref:Transthyretin-like family protein n=1 Tax=Parastrongyloides trichosuri TaxID=131310 RepID=A0A0N4ZM16_PARTI
MASKNMVLYLFLILIFAEQSTMRKKRPSRLVDVPYNVTGRVMYHIMPFMVAENSSDKEGNFILLGDVPEEQQKNLRILFIHKCDPSIRRSGLFIRLTTRDVPSSKCTFKNRGIKCTLGDIQLASRRRPDYNRPPHFLGHWVGK